MEAGGTYFLEVMTVYVMVRFFVRTLDQIIGVIRSLFWLMVVATLAAIPEAITGVRFIHEFAQAETGHFYPFSGEERLGMLRAASSLSTRSCSDCSAPRSSARHGSQLEGFPAPAENWAIVTGTFFSLSSAPLLVGAAQIGLIGLERTTRWLGHRVAIFSTGAIGLLVALQVFSGRGAIGVVTLLMLDPDTAWYRKAQIDYSMDDIMRHPLFGLGTESWTRPAWVSDSIDDNFLFIRCGPDFLRSSSS